MGAVLVPMPATDSALAIYAHARGIVPSASADSGPERKRDQKQVDNHRHRDGKPLVPGFLIEKYRQQARHDAAGRGWLAGHQQPVAQVIRVREQFITGSSPIARGNW